MTAHGPATGARERRARLLVQAALAAIVLATLVHTRADPDLWGHVAFGRDIVATRSVPSADPYSFTSDVRWVNHEWLAEVAMFGAWAALGGPGLIALKVLAIALALGLAQIALRRQGVTFPARDLLLAVAAVASIQQANAVRPQIFSILLFAALLATMVRVERGRLAAIAWVPVILLAWVNLHGGWIVGAGTLALWATTRLLQAPASREARAVCAVSAASAAATLINPYGWDMWGFLLTTVRPQRLEISDWQPVYHMGPGVYLTWGALVAIAALALWRSTARPPLARVLVVVALAAGAFRVNRLLMFLAFAIVILLGPQVQQALGRRRKESRGPAGPVATAAAAATAVVLLAGALGTTAVYGRCVIVESARWPEPGAAGFIAERARTGRMLTWFDWGEYAIWHLAPGIKVSMDGRRETVYSPRVLADHLSFYYDGRSARAFLDALQVDYIWLPASLPVVSRLETGREVEVLWRGPKSVLFSTRPGGAGATRPATAEDPPRLSRCFPGP